MKHDPGIPNLHPLKDELLRKAEEKKEKLAEEAARQKNQRKQLVDQRRNMERDLLVCKFNSYLFV